MGFDDPYVILWSRYTRVRSASVQAFRAIRITLSRALHHRSLPRNFLSSSYFFLRIRLFDAFQSRAHPGQKNGKSRCFLHLQDL